MKAAAENQARLGTLKLVQACARQASRKLGQVTCEDAYRLACDKLDWTLFELIDTLGNAAGSIFKGMEWEFTGSYRQVALNRRSHARDVKVWRLK